MKCGLDRNDLLNAKKLAEGSSALVVEEDLQWNNLQHNKESKNILFKGDNLNVLKHLLKTHTEKIKFIYVDPPYNINQKSIYKDNFNSHEAYLDFIYPRLYLARKLLKEDGVLALSIDDCELEYIKIALNEIFGEENHIATLIRRTRTTGHTQSRFFVKEHEYCLLYAKNKINMESFYLPHEHGYLKRYKEQDEKGRYFWDTLVRNNLRRCISFEVETPDGTKINRNWNMSELIFEEKMKNGELRFRLNKQGKYTIYKKQRFNAMGNKPRSLLLNNMLTQHGTNDFKQLFADSQIFLYPKPVELIRYLASLITKEDDIVLDFFAGSGTTGEAIIKLSAEDVPRRYILVQRPECIDVKTHSSAFNFVKNSLNIEVPTIFDITKERLIRASEKYKNNSGFKIFIDKTIRE